MVYRLWFIVNPKVGGFQLIILNPLDRDSYIFLPKAHISMKLNKSLLVSFVLLVVVSALYRVWEGRPFGFTPQIAMAIFGGAVIKDKRWAILLPLLSIFLSDSLYEILYLNGLTTIQGFYFGEGQITNYALILALTLFGFLMRRINVLNIIGFSVSGSLIFFIASNFFVWLGGGGFGRPKTGEGLLLCYNDALAFYRDYGLISGFTGNIILGDLFFCFALFGAYYLINKTVLGREEQLA